MSGMLVLQIETGLVQLLWGEDVRLFISPYEKLTTIAVVRCYLGRRPKIKRLRLGALKHINGRLRKSVASVCYDISKPSLPSPVVLKPPGNLTDSADDVLGRANPISQKKDQRRCKYAGKGNLQNYLVWSVHQAKKRPWPGDGFATNNEGRERERGFGGNQITYRADRKR